MGNDMFNDEQLAYAAIVQKETEDAVGFWKERALKAEAKLADKYLIEEQYEAACGDRDGLLRMVETLREQRDALTAERDRYRERLDQFEAAGFPNVAAALDRVNAAEAKVARLREANSEAEVQFLTELEAKRAAEARAEKAEQGGGTRSFPPHAPAVTSGVATLRSSWRMSSVCVSLASSSPHSTVSAPSPATTTTRATTAAGNRPVCRARSAAPLG